jgi:exosortase/archaeosortase family protein
MSGSFPQLNLETRFSRSVLFKIGLVLILGFCLLQTPIADHVSNFTATLLAVIAEGVLRAAGGHVLRTGTELRQISTGHALSVTEACDGFGILLVYLALAAGLSRAPFPRVGYAKAALAALLVIEAVNLLRIALLYGLLPAQSAGFDITHSYLFPLASALLIAILIGLTGSYLRRENARNTMLWTALAFLAAIAWYFVAAPVTGALLVPVANQLLPRTLIESIAQEGGQYWVNTQLVTSLSPLRAASLPFTPEAFSLGVPLLAASLVMAPAPLGSKTLIVACAVLSMTAAMALASITQTYGEAATSGLSQVVGEHGLGPYVPPTDLKRALAAATQNTLVYFNLFVLPFLILFLRAPSAPRPVPANRRRRNG